MVEVNLDRLRGCIEADVSARLDDIRSYLVSASEHLKVAQRDPELRLEGTRCALGDLSFAIEDAAGFDVSLGDEVQSMVAEFNRAQDLEALDERIRGLSTSLLSRQADSIMACVAGEAPRLPESPALAEARRVVAEFRQRWPGIQIPDPGPEPQPLEGPLEPPNIEPKGVVWAIRTAEGNARSLGGTEAEQRAALERQLARLLPRREFWERGTAKRSRGTGG